MHVRLLALYNNAFNIKVIIISAILFHFVACVLSHQILNFTNVYKLTVPNVSESDISIQFIRTIYVNTKKPSETVQKYVTSLWLKEYAYRNSQHFYNWAKKLMQRQLVAEMNPWLLTQKYVVLQQQMKASSVISKFAISFTLVIKVDTSYIVILRSIELLLTQPLIQLQFY